MKRITKMILINPMFVLTCVCSNVLAATSSNELQEKAGMC